MNSEGDHVLYDDELLRRKISDFDHATNEATVEVSEMGPEEDYALDDELLADKINDFITQRDEFDHKSYIIDIIGEKEQTPTVSYGHNSSTIQPDPNTNYQTIYKIIKSDLGNDLILHLDNIFKSKIAAVYALSNSLPVKRRIYMAPVFYAVYRKAVKCLKVMIHLGIDIMVRCDFYHDCLKLSGYKKKVIFGRNNYIMNENTTPKCFKTTLLEYSLMIDVKSGALPSNSMTNILLSSRMTVNNELRAKNETIRKYGPSIRKIFIRGFGIVTAPSYSDDGKFCLNNYKITILDMLSMTHTISKTKKYKQNAINLFNKIIHRCEISKWFTDSADNTHFAFYCVPIVSELTSDGKFITCIYSIVPTAQIIDEPNWNHFITTIIMNFVHNDMREELLYLIKNKVIQLIGTNIFNHIVYHCCNGDKLDFLDYMCSNIPRGELTKIFDSYFIMKENLSIIVDKQINTDYALQPIHIAQLMYNKKIMYLLAKYGAIVTLPMYKIIINSYGVSRATPIAALAFIKSALFDSSYEKYKYQRENYIDILWNAGQNNKEIKMIRTLEKFYKSRDIPEENETLRLHHGYKSTMMKLIIDD